MKRISGALLTISLAGCALLPGTPSSVPGVSGWVDFGDGYQGQASMADVAVNATVSLIDTSTNNTVSSTITNSGGSFNLSFSGWSPTEGGIYYFEAVKGLGNNQAGNSAARVRTMARFQSGSWQGIGVGSSIYLGRTTTALSVIASLRGPGFVPPAGLIQKVIVGTADDSIAPTTPDFLIVSGTNVSNADFHQVFGLVTDALTANTDPIERIVYESLTYKLKEAGSGDPGGGDPGGGDPGGGDPGGGGPVLTPPTLRTLSPNRGIVGSYVIIEGENFATTNASNSVSFNGTTTNPFSSSPTRLQVKVPTGATTGNVLVITDTGTSSAQTFTVTAPSAADIGGSFGNL